MNKILQSGRYATIRLQAIRPKLEGLYLMKRKNDSTPIVVVIAESDDGLMVHYQEQLRLPSVRLSTVPPSTKWSVPLLTERA